MLKDTKIIEQFEKHKRESQAVLDPQYENTRKCQRFYDGDVMSYKDTVVLGIKTKKEQRTAVQFNKVQPYVDGVAGFMTQNATVPKYEARLQTGQLQQITTEYANTVAGYVRDNTDAAEHEIEQNRDMIMFGYGATDTALSYSEGYTTTELEGEVVVGRVDPLTVGWDTQDVSKNVANGRFVYRWKDYDIEDALKLFDDSDNEDFEEAPTEDSKPVYHLENGGKYDKISPEFVDGDKELVRVYFYQWYELETRYRFVNPLYTVDDPELALTIDAFLQLLTGEDDELDPRAAVLSVNAAAKKELEDYFSGELEDLIEALDERLHKVYYTAVISGKKLFTKYKSVSQQGFTIKFKTASYAASKKIWVGMINSMMEPSLFYNKALGELMFTIASNAKGGVLAEKDAIKDITDFEKNYTKTNSIAFVENDALAEGRVQQKQKPLLPTGLDQIIAIADKAHTDVNGFDVSFMGSREFANDTARYQRQRMKQVASVLTKYFAADRMYNKHQHRMLLDFIRVFVDNNEGTNIRTGDGTDGGMFLELQSRQMNLDFDVVVSQTPMTDQDKEEQAERITLMGDKMAAGGDIAMARRLYAAAIKLMNLDTDIKTEVTDLMSGEQVDAGYVKQLEEQIKMYQAEERTLRLERAQASLAETMAKTQKIAADTEQTRADTVKTLEESEQKSLENEAIKVSNISETKLNINI